MSLVQLTQSALGTYTFNVCLCFALFLLSHVHIPTVLSPPPPPPSPSLPPPPSPLPLLPWYQVFQSNGESDDKDSPDAVSPVGKSTGMKVKFTCSDSEL